MTSQSSLPYLITRFSSCCVYQRAGTGLVLVNKVEQSVIFSRTSRRSSGSEKDSLSLSWSNRTAEGSKVSIMLFICVPQRQRRVHIKKLLLSLCLLDVIDIQCAKKWKRHKQEVHMDWPQSTETRMSNMLEVNTDKPSTDTDWACQQRPHIIFR